MSKPGVHLLGYSPSIFSYKSSNHYITNLPMHHSLCSANFQTSFFFKQSYIESIHLFCNRPYPTTSNSLPHVNTFSNPIILHSLNMAEASMNTFISSFIYPLRHFTQLSFPCILHSIHSPVTQQTLKVLHLHSHNSRSLLFHPFFSLLYKL